MFQVDHLKSLLAAESGNFASTVHALEERHRIAQLSLTKELSSTRQALATMVQQYAYTKQIFEKAESQLHQLKQRDTNNRRIVDRLMCHLTQLCSERQILSDRLGELESRLAWSIPTSSRPLPMHFDFQQLDLMNTNAPIEPTRIDRVANLFNRLSALECQIDQLQRTAQALSACSSIFQTRELGVNPPIQTLPNSCCM
ncbi:unnamed protein product [Echinostoma caproni]|uniref:Uncharacterized protein n=1 Tax=Echinostoma caproni TaxID=27848 RepID=A0A183BDZ2_9TREM|nr:unnamed protein product [Echinostoma caproni]